MGGLSDAGALANAIAGAEAVLHLAAVTHSRRPNRYDEVNIEGTRALLAAASSEGVKRFVYVSTHVISARGGAYSRSKASGERLVRQSALDTTIVRLPEIYGGASREGVDRIIELARKGRRIPIVGQGNELICPVHIDDAVDALVAGLSSGVQPGRTYTLAGECITLDEFARTCTSVLASRSRAFHVPIPAVAIAARLSRLLPLPIYPDQLARLRAPRASPSPEARDDLEFHPRPLLEGLAETYG